MRAALLIATTLLLAGCNASLNGTYRDQLGATQFTFERGGKVYLRVMGIETELEYEVDGKRVKIISPQGNQILTLEGDGTLGGPLGLRFTKDK